MNKAFECDPNRSWLENRNGVRDLTAVHVVHHLKNLGLQNVWLSGIGKSGAELRGGLVIGADTFEQICHEFLQERGYQITKAEPNE